MDVSRAAPGRCSGSTGSSSSAMLLSGRDGLTRCMLFTARMLRTAERQRLLFRSDPEQFQIYSITIGRTPCAACSAPAYIGHA